MTNAIGKAKIKRLIFYKSVKLSTSFSVESFQIKRESLMFSLKVTVFENFRLLRDIKQ